MNFVTLCLKNNWVFPKKVIKFFIQFEIRTLSLLLIVLNPNSIHHINKYSTDNSISVTHAGHEKSICPIALAGDC